MNKILLVLCLLTLSLQALAEKKKTVKENVNETADQIDQGTRKAIQEVKTLVKPKEKKP